MISRVLVAVALFSKGITVAEVIDPGKSIPPAPGSSKKGGKGEKIPRISSGIGLILHLHSSFISLPP
jgi:hypothetical protein